MSNCPSKNELQQFLADKTIGGMRDSIVAHIENCQRCQFAIEKILESQTVPEFPSAKTSVFQSPQKTTSKFSQISNALRAGSGAQSAMSLRSGSIPRLDGFKVIGEIGRGASSVVFEAIQDELDRRVAIKLYAGQLFSHADMKQRFLREARSVAALNHPNIAQLYQISEAGNGEPCLIFEFVDGVPLDEIIQERGSLTHNRAAEICNDVATATSHAHDNNLVHRDLKPSNILIQQGTAEAKVIDFGLAVDPDRQARLTQDSFIAGTPAYMSPEQIQSPKSIDHRSDVYSLGIVLYEMLTGDVPFRGLTKKTIGRVLDEIPQRPRTINPDIPRDLETICLKAISKQPQQRYATMSALADDIQRWQQGRSIKARPATRWTTACRWAQRNPLAASLAVAVATLLLLVSIGSTIGVMLLSQANRSATTAKQESDKAAAQAFAQRDKLLDTIDSLVYDVNDDVDVEYIDQDELQIRFLKIALDGLAETNAPDDSEVARRVGDINLRLATVYIRQAEYELAREHLLAAKTISQSLVVDPKLADQLLHSSVIWEQAGLAANESKIDRALMLVEQAEEFDQSISATIDDNLFKQLILRRGFARNTIGQTCLDEQSDADVAVPLLQAAIVDADTLLSGSDQFGNELDNWQYQALTLKAYALSGLADCHHELHDRETTAKFDSQSKQIEDLIAIYDFGNGDLDLGVLEVPVDDLPGVDIGGTCSLITSEQLFRWILNDSDSNIEDPFLRAGVRYRLGCLYIEQQKHEEALEEFSKCVRTLNAIEGDEVEDEFEIRLLAIDAQINLVVTTGLVGDAEGAAMEQLNSMIGEIAAMEPLQPYELRALERVKFEIASLQQ